MPISIVLQQASGQWLSSVVVSFGLSRKSIYTALESIPDANIECEYHFYLDEDEDATSTLLKRCTANTDEE
jgi:hypothetical protein